MEDLDGDGLVETPEGEVLDLNLFTYQAVKN